VDFSARNLRAKMSENLKTFHKNFLADLKEYCEISIKKN
jgi:hypothetical protein